jgi:peptide/nickel transport system permease protein
VLRYILIRVGIAISVIVAAIVVSFALFYLAPTDPAGVICGAKCSPARHAEIAQSLHVNDPIQVQVGDYLRGLVVGRTYVSGGQSVECPAPCLGYSYALGQPVTKLVGQALPVTASIVVGSATTFLLIGVSTGVLAARRRGTIVDRAAVGSSLVLGAIPYFVFALIVALYVAPAVGLTPEYHPLLDNPLRWALGLLIPWLTLGVVSSASYTRFSRASMIESLGEDFVRTARAKGITERRVVFRHALRAAATPILTLFGLDIAFAFAGTLFTETIFGLHGIGLMTLRAFGQYDQPVLMGGVLIGSVVLVVMNLVVDLFYKVLDPRVRLG